MYICAILIEWVWTIENSNLLTLYSSPTKLAQISLVETTCRTPKFQYSSSHGNSILSNISMSEFDVKSEPTN